MPSIHRFGDSLDVGVPSIQRFGDSLDVGVPSIQRFGNSLGVEGFVIYVCLDARTDRHDEACRSAQHTKI